MGAVSGTQRGGSDLHLKSLSSNGKWGAPYLGGCSTSTYINGRGCKNLQEETKRQLSHSLPSRQWLVVLICSYSAIVLYYHCRALPAIVLMFHVPDGPLTPSNTTPTSPVSQQKKHPRPGVAIERRRIWKGAVSLRNPPTRRTDNKQTRREVTWFLTRQS